MFGIHDFVLFLATGVLLNLVPGPDTAYILGRSIAKGRSAGIASALGISAGSIVHTMAAALALSAFLATSASAFHAVKLIGAAYLVFLGVRAFFQRSGKLLVSAHFAKTQTVAAFGRAFSPTCSIRKGGFSFLPSSLSSLIPPRLQKCRRS